MEKVPIGLRNDDASHHLSEKGLVRIHQGKVRDTWSLENLLGHNDYLLVVATDRVSIFDFVLNALIPKKGEVLTALSHFWLRHMIPDCKNHLIPSELDGENYAYDLDLGSYYWLVDILPRCLVVKNLHGQIWDFEMIFRHHIGGSVFKGYQQTGQAGGQRLPTGLPQWSKLDQPIFTPSTKEEVGHDVNVDASYFFQVMTERGLYSEAQEVVNHLIEVYKKAYQYAEGRGILILDTKFEVAGLTLADEVLTPDSSRFVKVSDWHEAMEKGVSPKFLDKQPIRDWGATIETPFYTEGKQIIGINKLDPKNLNHVNFVHGLTVPEKVITDATQRYLEIFNLLTDFSLEHYQRHVMEL